MRVCVVGAGYVGLVTAAVLADGGHQVRVVETDRKRLAALRQGQAPFSEPDLDGILARNQAARRLDYAGTLQEEGEPFDVIIIAVGTPAGPDGHTDLAAFWQVAAALAALPPGERVVAVKSTVPVGTGDRLEAYLLDQAGHASWYVASNPEFLRQGSAVWDTLQANRLVIGTSEDKAAVALTALYSCLARPVLLMDRRSAELMKYAANAFLAMKISFSNEIANLCDLVGADISMVTLGLAMDPRIGGAFLGAGIGFGGSCLPKDLRSLAAAGRDLGYRMELVEATMKVNEHQRLLLAWRAERLLEGLMGKEVAVWGLTYKPGTDDVRGAPALDMLAYFVDSGARVRAYDPALQARQEVAGLFPAVRVVNDMYQAVDGAQALMVLTEWEAFVQADWHRILSLMACPVVLDGRNCLDSRVLEAAGFCYLGVGRGRPAPDVVSGRQEMTGMALLQAVAGVRSGGH